MISSGFARGGEDNYSDSSSMNQMTWKGVITKKELSSYCYPKLAKKHGILRKQNIGTRPTKSFRLVVSPSLAVGYSDTMDYNVLARGYVEMLRRVFNRARFLYTSESGECFTRKMVLNETTIVGRRPSQGADSAIPLKVKLAPEGVDSLMIPLELCSFTHADFDGDEVLGLIPATKRGCEEADKKWNELWVEGSQNPVFMDAYHVAVENSIETNVDPALLTTMTFKEMSEHKGAKMYESMFLKPKLWKHMYSVMTSKNYWKSNLERDEIGIYNTAVSRNRLAVPYRYIRTAMMMGT